MCEKIEGRPTLQRLNKFCESNTCLIPLGGDVITEKKGI